MGIHDGHRQRLREEFNSVGLSSFNEVRALELLLFYSVPRKDTNVLAHSLISTFGSFEAVFSASYEELMAVDGVGEQTATLIRLIPEMNMKLAAAKNRRMKTIDSSDAARQYFYNLLFAEEEEVFYICCLDSQKRAVYSGELARGVVNGVSVDIRRICELSLKCRASAVIVSHNHPDSVAEPSDEDISTTKAISDALSLLGIQLLDHIIVAREGAVSLADLNVI